MEGILNQNNNDLLKEIVELREQIKQSDVPAELQPYKKWLLEILSESELRVKSNFRLLSLNQKILLPEILSETQFVTINLRTITAQYTSPIVRYSKADLFCLKAIHWIHNQHMQSQHIPFALSDGSFAIYPTINTPVIYFLPFSSLRNLRHISLIFHEFGHYLYTYHKDEMDQLVIELQDKIWQHIKPSFVGNDIKSQKQIKLIKKKVETWYEWTQELFCDAVGLHIGGATYLRTFSSYLRMMGRGQLKLPEDKLEGSEHPVSWLRISFLVERAEVYGLKELAEEIKNDWKIISENLRIKEDYFGYYHSSFRSEVVSTIDDMIVEANPIYFENYVSKEDNIIGLSNIAWERSLKDSFSYSSWEKSIVEDYKNKN